MAYLYRKQRPPFWYIQYIDADKIKHDKSARFRTDDPYDTAKAKALRTERESREYRNVLLINSCSQQARARAHLIWRFAPASKAQNPPQNITPSNLKNPSELNQSRTTE